MIYLFVLILLLVGVNNYDLSNRPLTLKGKTLFYMIGFALFCIAAFRYYNGGDTANYLAHFSHMPKFSSLSNYHFEAFRYQKGYIYFVSFLKEIWNNFLVQQIVTALFINVVIFRFVRKYSPYIFLTTLIYFMLNYFEYNMEIMRECISIALGILAYECLRTKKYILMALLMYVAYEFHISAIVLILLPILSPLTYSRKSFALFMVLAFVLPAIYMSIPNLDLYATLLFGQEEWINEAYIIQEYNSKLSINYYVTHIIKYLIIPFFSIWYLNRHNKFQFTGLVYAYALFQLLGMFSYAFYRFANYFAPFYWIAIASVMYLIVSRLKGIRGLVLTIILLIFMYLYQNGQFAWDKTNSRYYYNRYIPYKSVFLNGGYPSSGEYL